MGIYPASPQSPKAIPYLLGKSSITENLVLTLPFNTKQRRCLSESLDLKKILASKIPKEREKVRNLRKKHGKTKVGDVTVDMMYGGMRGVKGLIWETSVLDPNEGIRFRDFSIPEMKSKLPKVVGGHEPQPEGMFWLLLTGDHPTKAQVDWLSNEWIKRSALPPHVVHLLHSLPAQKVHPMTQLITAIAACNTDSKFYHAYHKGAKKTDYWDYTYDDAMDLLAKLPSIGAAIYRNTFKDGKVSAVQSDKDWTGNFTHMMGYASTEFTDLMRLYLSLHSDHEGGNVSAHAGHLVSSALSDVYLSFSASMAGLAGPLHGLANQESLIFLMELKSAVGDNPTDDKIKEYCGSLLKAGKVIPGFGHAVLRKTDPRYTCFMEFAQRHFPDDSNFKLIQQLFKLVPPILQATGKVQNPWPNVDAVSGIMLRHYGMKEMGFYTVCFGISRAIGVMASIVWSRALGFPIERPKSFSTDYLIKMLG